VFLPFIFLFLAAIGAFSVSKKLKPSSEQRPLGQSLWNGVQNGSFELGSRDTWRTELGRRDIWRDTPIGRWTSIGENIALDSAVVCDGSRSLSLEPRSSILLMQKCDVVGHKSLRLHFMLRSRGRPGILEIELSEEPSRSWDSRLGDWSIEAAKDFAWHLYEKTVSVSSKAQWVTLGFSLPKGGHGEYWLDDVQIQDDNGHRALK
jgi:hypothetical protein